MGVGLRRQVQLRDWLRREDPATLLSIIGIALVFLAGSFLRLRGLGTQLVFGDEIHALDILRGHGYRYLLTHFSFADTCIPLTLYYRTVMDTVGLNELWMRLPGAISGCATILLLAVFAWRRWGPLGSLLASGMLALSPYHVYLSREARPYPIIVLLLLAVVMAVSRWV
jgi:predicted membrane-bound mannosyltransferase